MATTKKNNNANDDDIDDARRPPSRPPPPNLDLAAAAFSLSPSAALGLDRTGAAADASVGPRVDHLIVDDDEEEVEDLVSFVAAKSDLSKEHALALLELGAVWWCPVPPPPPRSYGSSAAKDAIGEALAAAGRSAAEERHRNGRELHGRGMHLFKPRRASASDRPPRGSYVRVHVRPKRYFDLKADADDDEEIEEKELDSMLPTSLARVGYGPRAWSRRLVSLSSDFVILNKPPCVPSVPTVDNGLEHALSGAAVGIAEVLRKKKNKEKKGRSEVKEEAEGPDEEEETQTQTERLPPRHRLRGPQATGEAATGGLAAAHRLDHGASGVLAIGRSPTFVAGFQELSKRGRIAKVYRAALVSSTKSKTRSTETTETNSSSPPSLPRAGDTLVHWAEVNARPHGAPPRTLMFDGPSAEGRGGKEEGRDGEGEDGRERRERARCELRVVSMKRISLLPSAAEALGITAEGEEKEVWEACILLITGRTHQVRREREKKEREAFSFLFRALSPPRPPLFREKNSKKTFSFSRRQIRAQMAAVGFPLLGDVLYGTDDYSRVEAPGKINNDVEWRSNDRGGANEVKTKTPPPLPLDQPIALHAARLASAGPHALKVFGRDPAVFDAGAPWWRAGLGLEDERDLDRAWGGAAALEEEATARRKRSEGGEGEGEEESGGEEIALVA